VVDGVAAVEGDCLAAAVHPVQELEKKTNQHD
jgi:hypothetical protein